MAQIVPCAIEVPSRYSDMAIGYSIKTMDKKIYSSFKTATKSTVPNTFEATVIAPSNGGYIVWGLENSDLWLDTIEPQVTIPDFKQTLSSLIDRINELTLPVPTIQVNNQVDTTEFNNKIYSLSQSITEQLADSLSMSDELTKQLVSQMNDLVGKYNKLQFISDDVVEQTSLENLRVAFDEFVNSRQPTASTNLVQTETIINNLKQNRKQKDLDIMNNFLSKLEAL